MESNCTNGVVWAWGIRRKVNILEIKCLRSLDKVMNQGVSGRDGIERKLASRVDQRVLRWFDTWKEWMSTLCLEAH